MKTSLDLRGKRYEEAITETDRYIDAALLAGYDEVTIIHGKGTGALRSGITKYLKQNRRIKSFEYARLMREVMALPSCIYDNSYYS